MKPCNDPAQENAIASPAKVRMGRAVRKVVGSVLFGLLPALHMGKAVIWHVCAYHRCNIYSLLEYRLVCAI